MKKFLILLIIPFISFSQDNNDDMNYDYLKKRELNYDPNSPDFNRKDLIKDDDFWHNYLRFYPPQPEFKGAKGKLKKNINEIDLFSYHPLFPAEINTIPEMEEYIDNMSYKEWKKYVEKNTTIIELTVDELKELTGLSLLRHKSCFEKTIQFQIYSCKVYYYSGSEDVFSKHLDLFFIDEEQKFGVGTKEQRSTSLRRGSLKPIRHIIENAKPGDLLRFDEIEVNLYNNKNFYFPYRVGKQIVLKVV